MLTMLTLSPPALQEELPLELLLILAWLEWEVIRATPLEDLLLI